MRATLADVAERAGVSLAAASLALRGKPGVSDDTRRRVLDVANELGYRARTVDHAVTSIGVLVEARSHDVAETNAFYGPVIAGITEACTARGIDVRLDELPVDEHFDPIQVPRLVTSDEVRGLIVLGAYLSEQSARLLARRPVVLVDGYAADPNSFCTVVSDNTGGMATATNRLIELGHERIALVGTTPDAFPSILERRQGYEVAMRAAGLEPRFVDGHHGVPGSCVATAIATLDEPDPPTTFIGANDDVALNLLAELKDRVPNEVSVVGFDDVAAASSVRPRLDTVAIDKRAMGRLAVSLLGHRIAHIADPVFTVTQRAELVVRESSQPAAASA